MQEKIFINGKIPAILTLPAENKCTKKYPAVLLLHGFASDKNEIKDLNEEKGFYEILSLFLAALGIASLRIDFGGFGESKMSSSDCSLHTMLEDALQSLHYLTLLPAIDKNAIGIVGFSLGAAVAVLVAEKFFCFVLILISPAMGLLQDFEVFLGKKKMINWKKSTGIFKIDLPWTTVSLDNRFLASLSSYNPLERLKKYEGKLLSIAGEKDFSAKHVYSIMRMKAPICNKTHIIANADHVFNAGETNKRQEVIDIISSFLQQQLIHAKYLNTANKFI